MLRGFLEKLGRHGPHSRRRLRLEAAASGALNYLPRSNLLGPRVTVIRVGEYVEKDICWNVSNNG
jgi:hypothetical protein